VDSGVKTFLITLIVYNELYLCIARLLVEA
jgi:hypothetical protein